MIQFRKLTSAMTLLVLLLAVFVTPVYAFEDRTGDFVTIGAGEVIDDDLYVAAQVFTLDGSVTGDLVVFAQTITINGNIGGDLIAAGQTVIINGQVGDDARIAGAGLQLGDQAVIGDDLVAAGASLETRTSSSVAGELVVGAGQALLSGNVAGDVLAGTGGLELRGSTGGNVQAYVGEGDENAPPMNMYFTNSPITIPNLRPGLKVTDEASITGNLIYSSGRDISIPEGVVRGQISRIEPPVDQTKVTPAQTKQTNRVLDWGADLLRSMVTLILFGLLLVWIAPGFLSSLSEKIKTRIAPSLGWGVVAYAAFFFAMLVIIIAMILGGVVFGFLTLGSITATIIFVGLAALFALALGFILTATFLTKITVGATLGKWIFTLAKSNLVENRYWSMVLGVVIIAIMVALPLIGWLVGLVILFLGLGALWLWGRDHFIRQPA